MEVWNLGSRGAWGPDGLAHRGVGFAWHPCGAGVLPGRRRRRTLRQATWRGGV